MVWWGINSCQSVHAYYCTIVQSEDEDGPPAEFAGLLEGYAMHDESEATPYEMKKEDEKV